MSRCTGHESCPKCGSKDNLARYEDGSAYCFSPDCGYFEKTSGDTVEKDKPDKQKKIHYSGEFSALAKRGIKEEDAKFYGVKVDSKGNYVYPYYNEAGDIVATKVRLRGEKDFRWTGDPKSKTLFGQQLFGTSGKYLTITEGSDDAIAAYKLGGGFPVVAVESASSAVQDVLDNIDFVESYEKIKIAFDNDEAGRTAAKKVAEKLSPNKVEIVTFTKYKDANDYLRARDRKQYTQDWWGSKAFVPDGVKNFSDIFSSFRERIKAEIIPLPDFFGKAKDMLNGGLVRGEITTIVGDTSIGKTTLVNNILRGMVQNEDTRILYLGLETTLGELAGKMLSMEIGRNIEAMTDLEEGELDDLESKFNDIAWGDRLKVIDHRGSIDPDELIQKLRNYIVAFDCNVCFIDPLNQALPNSENDTVRHFMDSLLKLASQTRCAFVLTSHVRKRNSNDPHDISEDDALGSSAVKQVSYNMLLATRNKMADTQLERNSIKIVFAKNRRCGQTGDAGWLYYNSDSLILEEGEDPRGFDDEELIG